MTLGGSGAIFACGLARLGRPVRFFARVGRDATGDMLIDLLRRRNIPVSGVRRDPKVGTGIAVAISGTSDRALVSYLGTVATTTLRDLALDDLRRYDHLHLTSPFLQLGLRPHFVPLLKRARRAGLTTSIDPGWDPQKRWDLKAILREVDLLLVNEVEAEALTGMNRPVEAARKLSKRVALAVVKTGSKGAVAVSPDGEWRVPSFPVDPVDTTGAGDTFDAGFLDGWLAGRPMEEALRFGCACGALSTTKPGGYEGQPGRAEAVRFMKRRREADLNKSL
jgi:sugar/nucleoside kinase (ribokinase family)